jgi:phosphatidylserine/phosphatidylglycerophosphate/cardiolipin synthase-like enzyme
MRTKTKKRSRIRWAVWGLLAAAFYLILGATLPFAAAKRVSLGFAASFHTADFYGDTEGCDRAMLLETAESAWSERLRLMSMAQERILYATFNFQADESGRDLLAVLQAAADRGVQVKLLVDALHLDRDDAFTALAAHPNVEMKVYNRINALLPWTSQGRMHDKYVLVDDVGYILGGRNSNDLFLGTYEAAYKNRDWEVLVYNTAHGTEAGKESSLCQLETYFETIWSQEDSRLYQDAEALLEKPAVKAQTEALTQRYEGLKEEHGQLLEPFDYTAVTVPTERITLLHNPTGILAKEPWVFYSLTELMRGARESVLIHTPYAVCNRDMYNGLRAVCEAVPDVRMVLNSVENGKNITASSDYIRNKPQLLETGVSLYEYDGGSAYHGKSIAIDDELSIIGSYNLDMRSTYLDTELMLVIDSPELNAQLRACMAEFEAASKLAVDRNTYIIPEGHVPLEMSGLKRAGLQVLGYVLIPVRYLI